MVNCRFCGEDIDPRSVYCPSCFEQLRMSEPQYATPRKQSSPWPWIVAIAIIAVLIIATVGLWPRPSGNDQPGDDHTNGTLPNSKVLLHLSNEYYDGGEGEGFGCREPGTSGLGCKLETVYEDFKVTWSASAPMYLEVGTNEDDRKWFCMGHGCASAKSSGSEFVSADWSFYGNVWFHWGNDDVSQAMTVYELQITAYL